MEHLVIGADGLEYGPADLATLRTWVADGRVLPDTELRNFQTGEPISARQLPGLFPEAVPLAYVSPSAPAYAIDDGKGELWGSLVRSAAAFLLSFLLHTAGFIFGIYALHYAIQCHGKGNRYGVVAIIVAAVTLGFVIVGWMRGLDSLMGG